MIQDHAPKALTGEAKTPFDSRRAVPHVTRSNKLQTGNEFTGQALVLEILGSNPSVRLLWKSFSYALREKVVD
jgi:hypothetical protein